MTAGLFFGLTTIDIFNVVPRHPPANQKIRAEHQAVCAGGPAANAAVAFSALGNDARLASGLGSHPMAGIADADLRRHGVTVFDYSRDPDELPILSSIIIDASNGNRCVVYANPHGKRLRPDISHGELLQGCRVALFDGFYLEQAVAIARAARERSIITVLDGGSWKDGLDELLAFIDFAVCSEDFLPPGSTSVDEVLAFLMDRGISSGAVSRGGDPIIAAVAGNRTDIPVPETDAVDTLGAGDILHGAFCHYITDHPFTESLQLAARVASQSCRYRGTREWINYLQPSGPQR